MFCSFPSIFGTRLACAVYGLAMVVHVPAQGGGEAPAEGPERAQLLALVEATLSQRQLAALPSVRGRWLGFVQPVLTRASPWDRWPDLRLLAIDWINRGLLPMWSVGGIGKYEEWFLWNSVRTLAGDPRTRTLADRVCAVAAGQCPTRGADFWAQRASLALARLDFPAAQDYMAAAKAALERLDLGKAQRTATERNIRGVEQRLLIEAGRFDEAIERAAQSGAGQPDLVRLSKFAALEQWRDAERLLKRMLADPKLPAAWRGALEFSSIKIALRGRDTDGAERLRSLIERERKRFGGRWRPRSPNGLLELAWMESAYQACRAGNRSEAGRCLDRVRPLFERSGPIDSTAAQWSTLRAWLALEPPAGSPDPNELAAAARDVERVFRAWGAMIARDRTLAATALLQLGARRDLIAARIRMRAAGYDGDGASIPVGNARQRAVLDALLDIDSFDSLVRRHGFERPGADAVARALPSFAEGGAVLWLPAPLGSLAVTIRQRRNVVPAAGSGFPLEFEVIRLRSDLRLWNDTQRFEEMLRTPSDVREREHEWQEMAAQLDARMWPARLQATVGRWRQIAFIGRELAARLPAELLTAADGRPLALSAGVAYLPSITVAAWLDGRRTRESNEPAWLDVACLAATAPKRTELARLEVGSDLDRALAAVGGAHRLWQGPAAKIEAFEAAIAWRPRTLELLGHGVFDDSRAPPQGLALADADLWASSFDERVPPGVMLLSCSSGGGLLRRGDTVGNHLGGAALLGGADWVALSDVDLRLEPMLAQLREFHRAMEEVGEVPALAMMLARRRLVERGRHLAEFVALRLEGLAYRPLRPLAAEAVRPANAAGGWWWSAVVGGLVAALAGAWWLRRRG